LEGRIGTPAGREVGCLKPSYAGIKHGLGEASHIRRGIDPHETRLIVRLISGPSLARNDLQMGIDSALTIVEARKLAERHAMAYGQGMIGDERAQVGIA